MTELETRLMDALKALLTKQYAHISADYKTLAELLAQA